jgi:hypothetical protein
MVWVILDGKPGSIAIGARCPLILGRFIYLNFDVRSLNPVKTGSLVASQTRIIECNPQTELNPVISYHSRGFLAEMTRLY